MSKTLIENYTDLILPDYFLSDPDDRDRFIKRVGKYIINMRDDKKIDEAINYISRRTNIPVNYLFKVMKSVLDEQRHDRGKALYLPWLNSVMVKSLLAIVDENDFDNPRRLEFWNAMSLQILKNLIEADRLNIKL